MRISWFTSRQRNIVGSAFLLLTIGVQTYAGGRLLATGGVMSLEGGAGGGLTPWALIAGLGTQDQVGASASCTEVRPQAFSLEVCGLAIGIDNRLELSMARQRFDLDQVVPGQALDLTVVGGKLRLYGDLVVDQDRFWPQVALGVQWKRNSSFDGVPRALGAHRDAGVDTYLSGTKLWLDGPLGHSWLADVTLRWSEANQFGLLGFGGDRGSYHLLAESSAGVFVTDQVLVGAEYRQKPNNLSSFREDDATDLFIAWIPTKSCSLTIAYADLGSIAGRAQQVGTYFSLQVSL